jgi:hypothetical protein
MAHEVAQQGASALHRARALAVAQAGNLLDTFVVAHHVNETDMTVVEDADRLTVLGEKLVAGHHSST